MLTDEETGEILLDRQVDDSAYIDINIQSEKQKQFLRSKNRMENMESDLGGFYMLYYNEKLFDGLISDKHIAKVIYLATFVEYDTNRLVFPQAGRKAVPFTEQDVKTVLGLTNRTTYAEFKKEIIDSGIMLITDDGIYMSKQYFNKGTEKGNQYYFVKMYIDTIRQLYRQTSTRQHKTLGHLFKLIPYVDYRYNIITKTPNDPELAVENRLTKEQVAQLLEMDLEAYKKVENQLLKLKIDFRGKTYCLIGHVTLKTVDVDNNIVLKNHYVVNPLIYSSINNYEALNEVCNSLWFRMLKCN